MVRGLTRPNGEPLEQTKVSFQAGEVGNKLGEGSTQIQAHGNDLDRLVNGSNQLADALAQLRDQVTGAVSSLSGVVGERHDLHRGKDQTGRADEERQRNHDGHESPAQKRTAQERDRGNRHDREAYDGHG